MVGLDAAGKTTILYKLKLGEIVTTIPTIGKPGLPTHACFGGFLVPSLRCGRHLYPAGRCCFVCASSDSVLHGCLNRRGFQILSLEFGLCVLIQGDGRAVFRLSQAGFGGMNLRPCVSLLSLLLIFALLRWIRLHGVVVHGHELFFWLNQISEQGQAVCTSSFVAL
jgi:hypothetical protein